MQGRRYLVNHGIADARGVAVGGAALARNGVHLIEYDDVQLRGVARCLPLGLRRRKQLAHAPLRLAHKLVEDLWTVDHLWFAGPERASQLAGKEGLPTPWRAREEDAAHVRHTQPARRLRIRT